MKYWRIDYYKTRNWIDTKYIKDECAQGAINKARVKYIVDVEEISEEEYKAGLARRKAAAQAKKARRIDGCYGYFVIDELRYLADCYGCKPEELEIYLSEVLAKVKELRSVSQQIVWRCHSKNICG